MLNFTRHIHCRYASKQVPFLHTASCSKYWRTWEFIKNGSLICYNIQLALLTSCSSAEHMSRFWDGCIRWFGHRTVGNVSRDPAQPNKQSRWSIPRLWRQTALRSAARWRDATSLDEDEQDNISIGIVARSISTRLMYNYRKCCEWCLHGPITARKTGAFEFSSCQLRIILTHSASAQLGSNINEEMWVPWVY